MKQSLIGSCKALKGVLQAANQIVPGLIFAAVFLSYWVIRWASLSDNFMMASTLLLVLGVSLVVFLQTNDFGQSALALVAGLLTVFSVEWNANRFMAFSCVWVGFSLFALLISSVKLAAKLEDIYVHTAISMSNDKDEIDALHKRLDEIGKKST